MEGASGDTTQGSDTLIKHFFATEFIRTLERGSPNKAER